MRITCRALGMLLFAALPAHAQQAAPQEIDVGRLGPQRGEIVPDFGLFDAQGNTWTRDSIMGPNGAMVVFSRSRLMPLLQDAGHRAAKPFESAQIAGTRNCGHHL